MKYVIKETLEREVEISDEVPVAEALQIIQESYYKGNVELTADNALVSVSFEARENE